METTREVKNAPASKSKTVLPPPIMELPDVMMARTICTTITATTTITIAIRSGPTFSVNFRQPQPMASGALKPSAEPPGAGGGGGGGGGVPPSGGGTEP